MSRLVVLAVAAVAATSVEATSSVFTPKIVDPAAPVRVRSFTGNATARGVAGTDRPSLAGVVGTLDALAAEGYSDGPLYLVNITAPSHYGAGYAYGRLLANESLANFDNLFAHELPT
jgi:hypothetical protein